MKRVSIDGVVQSGYPNQRLIEAGSGLAYRKKDIWYLYIPGKNEADDGVYYNVKVVTVNN